MTRHVWLSVPSAVKADRLLACFREARRRGVTPRRARVFAGYACEQMAQHGAGRARTEPAALLAGVVRAGWRILKGHNAGNYEACFVAHRHFWLPAVAESAGLDPSAPWEVVNDWLVDQGRETEAVELRAMFADSSESDE